MSLFIELQKTLSFYEPMSLEMIFIDLDEGFLKANSELTTEDLLAELRLMEKIKSIENYIHYRHWENISDI